MIFVNQKAVVAYVASAPCVLEVKASIEQDDGPDAEEFREISKELVRLINHDPSRPLYGTDWGAWLDDNIEALLQEAIGIVM